MFLVYSVCLREYLKFVKDLFPLRDSALAENINPALICQDFRFTLVNMEGVAYQLKTRFHFEQTECWQIRFTAELLDECLVLDYGLLQPVLRTYKSLNEAMSFQQLID